MNIALDGHSLYYIICNDFKSIATELNAKVFKYRISGRLGNCRKSMRNYVINKCGLISLPVDLITQEKLEMSKVEIDEFPPVVLG